MNLEGLYVGAGGRVTAIGKMDMDQLELAALLCSRLCHDLVSPVGAVNNGIEILAEEDDPDMRAETLAMLEDSARKASEKLQFYRLAFGASSGFGEQLDLGEAERTLRSFFNDGRTEIHWTSDQQEAPKDFVKLLLNLALIAGEGLVRGGRLAVQIQNNGAETSLKITADGERFIISDKIVPGLDGKLALDGLEPRILPAYIAFIISQSISGNIDVSSVSGTGMTICFTRPAR